MSYYWHLVWEVQQACPNRYRKRRPFRTLCPTQTRERFIRLCQGSIRKRRALFPGEVHLGHLDRWECQGYEESKGLCARRGCQEGLANILYRNFSLHSCRSWTGWRRDPFTTSWWCQLRPIQVRLEQHWTVDIGIWDVTRTYVIMSKTWQSILDCCAFMIKDTPCEDKEGAEWTQATAYRHCIVTGRY